MQKIAIFGATGTIGENALDVIRQHRDKFCVTTLIAEKNWHKLADQAKEFNPEYVGIANEKFLPQLRDALSGFKIKIVGGEAAINDLANEKFDLFLAAITGTKALIPTFNAIKSGAKIGMANKECLVAAGQLLLKEARKNGAEILPIDSEHNAIYQILEKQNLDKISEIILTASGGPFLYKNPEELQNITVEEAICHPNWRMGAKISVDSATMMNKALEVIEAYHLFNLPPEKIKIVIHPQSIIHGLVSYEDGATLAMMSEPDMKIPISHILGLAKSGTRLKTNKPKLDLVKIAQFDFLAPNLERFPVLNLLTEILRIDQNFPCIFNAAGEVAVANFLAKKVAFNDIIKITDQILEKSAPKTLNSLEEIIACDIQTKKLTQNLIDNDF